MDIGVGISLNKLMKKPFIPYVPALGISGCIAEYLFDSAVNGVSPDTSGNAKDATHVTSVDVTAKKGKSLRTYEGSNRYAKVPDIGGIKSISVWLRNDVSSSQYNRPIFSHTGGGDDYILNYAQNETKKVFVMYLGGSYSNEVPYDMPLNVWKHVVLNYVSDTATDIYVDNVKIGQFNRGLTGKTLQVIGAWIGDTYGYDGAFETWRGYIDQIRLFNKALSASEISTLYGEN